MHAWKFGVFSKVYLRMQFLGALYQSLGRTSLFSESNITTCEQIYIKFTGMFLHFDKIQTRWSGPLFRSTSVVSFLRTSIGEAESLEKAWLNQQSVSLLDAKLGTAVWKIGNDCASFKFRQVLKNFEFINEKSPISICDKVLTPS